RDRQVRLPGSVEPRSVPRQAPARAVRRRGRARAGRVRHLSRWPGPRRSVNVADAPTHEPVLVAEVVDALQPARGGVFADCTLGLGGHTRALLDAGADRVIGIDRDRDAIAEALRRLGPLAARVDGVHADYRELPAVLASKGLTAVAGLVAD